LPSDESHQTREVEQIDTNAEDHRFGAVLSRLAGIVALLNGLGIPFERRMDGQVDCSPEVARAIDAVRQDGEADTAGNPEEGVSVAAQQASQSPSTSPAALDGGATDPESAARDLHARRQSQLRKQNRFTQASVIIPPENFAYVEDGLYRSVRWTGVQHSQPSSGGERYTPADPHPCYCPRETGSADRAQLPFPPASAAQDAHLACSRRARAAVVSRSGADTTAPWACFKRPTREIRWQRM
jgi:hypothetical protein